MDQASGYVPSDQLTQAGTERKRTRRASLEEESTESNTVISIPPSTTPLTSTERTRSDGRTPSCDPNLDISKELGCERSITKPYIDAYFEHIAPRPENGFIHRAIFLRAWTSGAVDPTLLKAICSASAAFVSTETAILEQAEQWRTEAEAYVWANIGRPSITVLQILVLVISQNCALFRFLTLQPLLGIASKMAYMLRLNHENNMLSTTAREIRRRIMWSIFFFDRKLAAGQSDLSTCPVKSMHIQLPVDEKGFDLAIAGKTGRLIPGPGDENHSAHMGTRAYFCRLSHIRHEILQYTRKVIAEGSSAHDSRSELFQLEHDLQDLRSSLSESLALNESNLYLRAYSSHMQRFMLPGIRESLPDEALKATIPDYALYCQIRVVEHAKALVQLFQMVQKVGDQTPLDPGISVCVFQCTRIIIRAYQIGLLGSNEDGTVSQFANQIYKEIKSLIDKATAHAADYNPNVRTRETPNEDRLRDHNILDILARIRNRDIERGEEVLQCYPASPTATTPAEIGSAMEEESCDTENVHADGVSGETSLEETLWDLGFEPQQMLDPFTAVFDDFGGPRVNFLSPDLNQL
ncbi:hypothetical protein PENARI_c005G05701 [Penicillium arizonense]|uniref:Xylanolytic transcriptional activator regulatory domain-containing protein n=1 Tax=Penicillium arizonense TaxID=1835702 RepID=A0A1F5LPY0_PENAI|nr:hypothetical protein PENARI_c005G05701 [Penicillium arizonense]OGE55080.1 hypothetical protein PENARI_c005G05701 [Penicillium arizonense]